MTTTLLSRVLLPPKSPISPSLCSRSFSHSLPSLNDGGPTGSGKLFADAVLEEAEDHANNNASKSHLQFLENQHVNWDGEERMEDAVLRMLVDKYKPLRGGTIRTAEEKLKQTSLSVRLDTTSTNAAKDRQSDWANQTILPAIEGHKPWLTTYKVPSHAATSIRTGRYPPASARSSGASSVDDRTRRKEIELKKREKVVGRLTKAKESTLDYRLGINRAEAPKQIRPNPISLRGWTSLIEDKIEVSRNAGLFNKVSGRGRPLMRQMDESNPFIAREEFLMNRIVQRNGAAPPWVEVQGELESAVTSFREILRQSWIRRALRTLTLSKPPAHLYQLTLADITAMRDPEWEERERKYHDTAVEDVNALVRKYNGLAPYAVRRAYYARTVELEKAYTDAGSDILRGIKERGSKRVNSIAPEGNIEASEETRAVGMDGSHLLRIRDVIREWLSKLTGWSRSR
ncbi:hypothetical protein PILCRDRAFT_77840 [Piloderma croceum F 1598]|uniref:DnaJ homologue subfamily C member 28 conserved domain-containing protein n=1 Tax=Piloderma croceum (strain F 1598) TaxID=765440 RepID=A0A0C3F8S8_PILCF|nr:hypothetical protein PILCRDRAFT_77840 [Piloderma croceum F 1598]